MGKRKVIFSYDYELFFGVRSGTVRKTLIEPTSLLLDGMERCGAKGNFFVDCSMLTAMSRQGEALIEDYAYIEPIERYSPSRTPHRTASSSALGGCGV